MIQRKQLKEIQIDRKTKTYRTKNESKLKLETKKNCDIRRRRNWFVF